MDHSNNIVYDRFILEELIGEGGVGEVWRAQGKGGGKKFALKMLRPQYLGNAQLRRRFMREARATQRLGHENVASVFDFDASVDPPFIALELIDGPSVAEAITTGVSFRGVLETGIQIASGLAHAHARTVVHRDLKPENILLHNADLPHDVGVAKIVDFGIATLGGDHEDDHRQTQQGEVVGTPRYMSPEQAIGERNLGPQTDIYCLGLILYEMVTSKRPFGDSTGLAVMSHHVHDPIPRVEPRDGLMISDDLIDVILQMLEKNPSDRQGSAGVVRDQLQAILEEVGDEPAATRAPTTDRRRHTRPEMRAFSSTGSTRSGPFSSWRGEVEFVGRHQQRERLMAAADRAKAGTGSIVILEGEAGVGKSRLANWYRTELEERGGFRASAGSFAKESSGLRGVSEVLESMFRVRGAPREKVKQRITDRLAAWGHTSEEDAATLTEFLRPTEDIDDTRPSTVSTSAMFALMIRTLEIASNHMPRVLLLDDVHWAGRELFDFLESLAIEMRTRSLPMVIVATTRTEDLAERPDIIETFQKLLRFEHAVFRVMVDRLSEKEGAELIEAILPSNTELRRVVLDRSSGNPLHVLLLLRFLRQADLLEWHEGRWRAKDSESVENAVPPSLGELFQGRLEQARNHYGTDVRLETILQFAAFAGPQFRYDVLRTMILESQDTLQGHLDVDLEHLVAEGFLVEIPGRAIESFGFSHALVRDFIVQNTPVDVATNLHLAAAHAWSNLTNPEKHAMSIAEHFAKAGDEEAALHWFKHAGDHSLRTSELRKASRAYEAVLTIFDRRIGIESSTAQPLGQQVTREEVESSNVDVAVYLEVLSKLGDLFEGFGDFATAERGYRRVVRLVGRELSKLERRFVKPLGYSWLGLGHIAWQRGDFEASEWAFHKVHEIVGQHPEPKLHGEASRGLARVFWYRGHYERAQELANLALQTAVDAGHIAGQAESVWITGEILRVLGDAESARAQFERSLHLASQTHDVLITPRNLLSLAQVARYQKDFPEARVLYSRALAYYENLGDRRGQGQCFNGVGDIDRFESNFDDAERSYTTALDLYNSIGAEYDVAVVMANLGINSNSRGDFVAAQEYLLAASNVVRANDYPYLVAGIEYNLALSKALSNSGDADIDEVIETARRIPIADLDYAQPLERLARIQSEAGASDEARELWQHARQIYQDLGLEIDSARIDRYLAEEKPE